VPATDLPALSVGALLSRPSFWAIGLGTGLAMGIFQGLIVSLVPIAREAGFTTTRAATLISTVGITAISGKMIVAWLADRVDRSLALSVLYAMLAASSVAMPLSHSFPALVGSSLLIGLSTGAAMPLYMALLADRFGTRTFGTASGIITFITSLLGAAAVRFGGEVFDRTGGYQLMFTTFCGLGVLAALLVFSVRGHDRRRRVVVATP
jgi:cyanate permease